MAKLQALQSIYFKINGKTFQCIGTLGTDDKDDCIDIIKELATGKLHRVKRSYTMTQNIKWLGIKEITELED